VNNKGNGKIGRDGKRDEGKRGKDLLKMVSGDGR